MRKIQNAEETVKDAMRFMAACGVGSVIQGNPIRFTAELHKDSPWIHINFSPETDCYL